MNYKKAIVLGASGMLGNEIVRQLIEIEFIEEIHIFVRRPISVNHEKVVCHIVDFEEFEDWKHLIKGDFVFSSFGTTLKKAGSKEKQYRIDFTYQFNFAKFASENNSTHYFLISAAGANPKSSIFYSKMKGELDEKIKQLNFKSVHIFRPGILDGNRQENRPMEQIALRIMRILFGKIIPLTNLKPIHVSTIAGALMLLLKSNNLQGYKIISQKDIFKLAQNQKTK